MKKILAALAVVTLTAGLSLAAVVAPASADDTTTPTPTVTSTPTVAPTDPAPAPADTTPAPADTTPAPADTTPAPADTTPAPDVAPPAPVAPLSLTVQAAVASFTVTTKPQQSGKAFVCKYVGTPGTNERLQTGQNPIDVSVNAIGENPVVVGTYFNDSQGRSYVLALDTGQPDPSVTSCPTPTPIYETVVWSMPSPFNGSDATYPQVGVTQYKGETTQTLDVAVPTTCGTQYQVDAYAQIFGSTDNTSALDALFAAGLAGPNGAQDGSYLAGAGSNPGVFGLHHAWKFVQNPACLTLATPVSPTIDPITTCGQYGSITIPSLAANTTGVVYTYNGAVEPAGTVLSGLSGAQSVVATPALGYVFNPVAPSVTYNLDLGTYATCDTPDSSKITFCHADGQSGNYNKLTTSLAAFYTSGHIDHAGDIFPAGSVVKKGVTNSWDAQGDQSLLAYPDCAKPIVVVLATPVSPTIDPITTCGQYGSITIPSLAANTTGVVYTYNGTVEPAGTVLTGLSGAQSVVATPDLGYVFNPAAPSVTYNLDLGTYTTCAVTTTDPTSANPVCTGDNSPNNGSISILSNVFVEYTLTGPGISGGQDFQTSATDGTTETIDGLAPGDYTVTATGLSGHTINDQTVFQFSIITLTSPDCTVVAPTVSWTLASCAPDQEQIASAGFNAADTEILGGITLPADSDVTYEIDGVVTPAGGPYSEADGTHVITATLTSAAITAGKKIVANPGVYTLSDGDTVATWTVDFTASCLPTLAVLPWSVASTNAICTPSGQDGTVTVTDDTSQASTVTYIVTNLATNATLYSVTTTSTFSLAPGHYNVRAIPTDTADFGLTPNNGGFAYVDTAVTIAAAATSCGDLTSLAFTGGTIGWLGFVVAGGMLFLGIAFLYMKRRGNRTAE